MLITLVSFLVILVVTAYLTTQINVRAFTEQQTHHSRIIAEQNKQLKLLETKLGQTAADAAAEVESEVNVLKSAVDSEKKKYQTLERKYKKLLYIMDEMRTSASSREYIGNTMAKMIVRKINTILPTNEEKEKHRQASTQGSFSRIKNRL